MFGLTDRDANRYAQGTILVFQQYGIDPSCEAYPTASRGASAWWMTESAVAEAHVPACEQRRIWFFPVASHGESGEGWGEFRDGDVCKDWLL